MKKRVGSLGLTLLGTLWLLLLLYMTTATPSTQATVLNAATPGAVVINEIAWAGHASYTADEWIELFNTTTETISLEGWRLYASDLGPTLTLHGDIGPQGYYLIERTDDDTISNIPANWIGAFTGGSLSNDGEVLYLKDEADTLIDSANGDGGGWPAGTAADGSPAYATMERIDPLADDTDANWTTNDGITINGEDAGGNPILGTPKAENSQYVSSTPEARLHLIKTGPSAVGPEALITYQITLSNTGTLTATGVVVTDTLPVELDMVSQSSPYAYTITDRTLRWTVGTLPTTTRGQITLIVSQTGTHIGTVITNVVTATDAVGHRATDIWETALVPNVRLYALQPGNYGGAEESAALINLGTETVSLAGWCLDDRVDSDTRVCFSGSTSIAPKKILWLAKDAAGFEEAWGFSADVDFAGQWPGFTDNGETAYLLNDQDHVVDALAYGKGAATSGWTGDAVPHPYAGYNNLAQVLYRKLDEATGWPVPDTDTAADWAQDPDDPYHGRKVRYPGWDLESLFFPAEITSSHALTLAVAPDASLEVVSRTLRSARESILIEGYSFESLALYETLEKRMQAGVAVTLLLESNVVGGIEDVEKWLVQQIDDEPNGHVYFMDDVNDDLRRYRYQHAKFVLVDGKTALISTDNFTNRSMPADRLDNGTRGHRGMVVVTEAPGVIDRLQSIFDRDCDPTNHVDIVPYGPTFAPPAGYVPLPDSDWTTYTAAFSQPIAAMASHITVMHAPEHSLRDSDALIGLLSQASSGDHIAGMQLNEPLTWTRSIGVAGRNPRVQALIDAARRGATVQLLLDAYYDDPLHDNKNTATCLHLNNVADVERLDLSCRLANVTGLGIHAKMFLINLDATHWVHLGSLNGSETSNKVNREVAVQFESATGYTYLQEVFEGDWEKGHGPLVHRLHLPLVFYDYVPPADHPLLSEIYINPPNEPDTPETRHEWVEIYHPGNETVDLSGWTVGDALTEGDYRDGRYTFPEGTTLLPKQVLVIAACATDFAAAYGRNPDYEWLACNPTVPDLTPAGAWDGFELSLGNPGDEILLHDATGALIDSAAWGGSERAGVVPFVDFEDFFPTDSSLERTPAHTDRDDCSRDFWIAYTPDPGEVWTP